MLTTEKHFFVKNRLQIGWKISGGESCELSGKEKVSGLDYSKEGQTVRLPRAWKGPSVLISLKEKIKF